MLVVFRWVCPYTTGPSPATRIWASATTGKNSRMVSPIPVSKRFMNTSLAVKSTRFRFYASGVKDRVPTDERLRVDLALQNGRQKRRTSFPKRSNRRQSGWGPRPAAQDFGPIIFINGHNNRVE